MLKKIMMATLAVGALALNAPAAQAADVVYDCSFDSVRQEDATGQNYEGAIWGFVADSEGGAVSIRCYITVNGADVDADAEGSGTGVAVAAGPISFTATPEDDVDICAEINGVFAECFQGESQQIPPQEVIDAINGIFQLIQDLSGIPDPLICPIIADLSPGVPGVVDIDEEGDVAIAGEPFWNCPPYET